MPGLPAQFNAHHQPEPAENAALCRQANISCTPARCYSSIQAFYMPAVLDLCPCLCIVFPLPMRSASEHLSYVPAACTSRQAANCTGSACASQARCQGNTLPHCFGDQFLCLLPWQHWMGWLCCTLQEHPAWLGNVAMVLARGQLQRFCGVACKFSGR
jgi:hypothetical protein